MRGGATRQPDRSARPPRPPSTTNFLLAWNGKYATTPSRRWLIACRRVRDYMPQAQKTRTERLLQSFAQTRFGGRLFVTVFPAIDRRLLPLTRGRLSTGLGQPVVLLHVRGAQSGIERTVPLLATKTGDRVLLVASKAGAAKHPAWYHNVRADPDVEVTIDGLRRPMRAQIAAEEERDRLWRIVCDNYSGYATYQRRAGGRVIPIVTLQPR
jgi:deazaflavin-dependent oxidoreductase (nitroreductase family)